MPSEPMSIEVVPVDASRFDDLQSVLHGGGDGPSCQCRWQLVRAAEWAATSVDEKRAALRDEVEAGDPAPGMLAYADGEPAGWVRVGPRSGQARILHAWIVRSGSAEPLDDPGVWAVTCFSVRRGYRRRGLVAELLAGAIGHARRGGARVLEAYPFDAAVGRRSANELYIGTLSTFHGAGFTVVARPTPARAVVSLSL